MSIYAFISTNHGNMPVEFPEPGKDFCEDCGDEHFISQLHTARRYDSTHRQVVDVKLCWPCAPHCGWTMTGFAPCIEVAMPGSEGGWCKHHDAIAETEYASQEASNG